MKYDMIIAGVGGQGILSIAAALGRAALNLNLHLKQSEVHGMAQRGGSVLAHLRLSDKPIHSDLVPRGCAAMILAMEPLEALRYLPWLDLANGWVVSNSEPIRNIDPYPEAEAIYAEIRGLPRPFLFNAEKLARDLGSPRAVNMAMLGAASAFMPLPPAALEAAIAAQFASKSKAIVASNIAVFHAGRAAASAGQPAPA
ncbi:MAG: indolepyruvate oxidoreductase subunit beta [Kiritimatiellia bacterium]